jgi:hypothetical protein
MDEDNITLYQQPILTLSYSIFNMKTIIPGIAIYFTIDPSDIKGVLKGEKE